MATIKKDKVLHPFRTVNKKVIDGIVQEIKEGATNRHAALVNGISPRHLYNLIAQGILDIECEKYETLPAHLVLSLSKIESIEIKECKKDIRASEKGHKGAEWILEHAFWRHFGKDAVAKEVSEQLELLRDEIKNGSKQNAENKTITHEEDSYEAE